VRILFSFVGGSGHFEPLVPIARAASVAGHTVAFTGEASMMPTVERTGFTGFSTGPRLASTQRSPLSEVDIESEERAIRESFARGIARRRAADVLELCATWRPDLIVCDEVDFGSMIAAERLGLPYASVVVIVAGSFVRAELVAEPLNELRAEYGLAPDPELTMLSRHLVLSPVPPSYRDPVHPLPATAAHLRPSVLAAGPTQPDELAGDAATAWLAGRSTAPLVYFTLGTIYNMESGDLFNRTLAGLRDLPADLIVTVGRYIDPAEFGPQPPNIHIGRYIPQASILPHCAVVVSHGGSGSVMGALAYGLPMLLLPLGADQPSNAARCERLGVARVLDAVTATPENIHEATSTILTEPRYRLAAQRIRAESFALPEAAYAVRLLEQIARP
jgi:UDP:flavonoid glycosyltransferase YjiC (YdhE family)